MLSIADIRDPATLEAVAIVAAVVFSLGYDWLLDRYYRHETNSAHGAAQWARRGDIKRAGLLGNDGVIVGRGDGKLLRYPSNKHLLTLAPNRAGKGVSSIIPNILTWPGAMVVVDPKGENAIVGARRRTEMGQDVHVLDPWGITGLPVSRFNPLLALDPQSSDLVEDAALLADALVIPGGRDDEAFWNNEAQSLIAGVLMHIITSEAPSDRHLGTLRAMVSYGDKAFAQMLEDMLANPSADGLVQRTADRLMQKTDRERSSVISTAQAQTHFLDSPRMTDSLSASDVDLAALKSGRTTIFLVIPADRLATHGRWLRLIISLTLSALTRERSVPERPVLLVLDEFAALGRLQPIETAIGLLAGYGALLWPILQDLSQLRDLYPNRWRSFLANAGVIQAFGVNDLSTAEYLSKWLGQRTVTIRNFGRSGDGEKQRGSESYAVTGRPLMMPQEILRMRPDQQLLFLHGQPPILSERVRYYTDAEFRGLFAPNPMVRG